MSVLKKYLIKFSRCESGVAFVEFALSISFMLLLFLGSVEISRALLITQKVEKVASTVADVTTQTDPNSGPVTTSQMSQLMSAVDDMMNPYYAAANIQVIITDVTKAAGANPVVNWQYCGGGTLNVSSSVGSSIGSTATLPNGFTMNDNEEVVIGEMYYSFTPLISSQIIGSFQIHKTAIYMPRLGALTGFSSHC